MTDDPIVAEIRRIREQMLDEADGDMDMLIAHMRAVAESWPGRKITVDEFRSERANAVDVRDALAFNLEA